MRERFNLRERINWISVVLLTLGIGSASLYGYFNVEVLTAKVILYLVAVFAITIGANGFVDFFESLVRGIGEKKLPFAESVFWLSPAIFTLYQFYALDGFIPKLLLGILVTVFSFLFLAALASAISDTELGKKKTGIFTAVFILSFFIIMIAIIWQSMDILVFFLPLIIMVSYSGYILSSFLQNSQSGESRKNQQAKVRKNVLTNLETTVTNLNRYFKRSFQWTLLLLFIFLVVSIFYVKGILPWPQTILNLYTVSLTVYTVLLSIITGFSILYLWQKPRRVNTALLTRPLLGLAQMCIVFIVMSLVGILVGADIDVGIFAAGVTPSSLLQSDNLLNHIQTILQVLVLEFVILSFPPTLMYIYAMLKGLLHAAR